MGAEGRRGPRSVAEGAGQGAESERPRVAEDQHPLPVRHHEGAGWDARVGLGRDVVGGRGDGAEEAEEAGPHGGRAEREDDREDDGDAREDPHRTPVPDLVLVPHGMTVLHAARAAFPACEDTPVHRVVTAEMELELASPVDLIFQITAAQPVPRSSEQLSFTQDDRVYTPTEIVDQSGTRLHRLTGEAGLLSVRYEAGRGRGQPRPAGRATSRRSRISARAGTASPTRSSCRPAASSAVSAGYDLIAAVSDFVATSTTYTPGLSHGTDSAVTTLMTGQGVCRDYAHVVIALLRAMDMPARYAACFAPGLQPMDFHAVAEAYLDGAWYVIDATRLADRRSLMRIATGRDAADCAFLSYHGGNVGLRHLRVDAWVASQIRRRMPTPRHPSRNRTTSRPSCRSADLARWGDARTHHGAPRRAGTRLSGL